MSSLFENKLALFVLALLALGAFGLTFVLANRAPVSAAPGGDLSKTQIETIVRDYLIANPEVLLEATDALKAKQEKQREGRFASAMTKNEAQVLRSPGDHVVGNPDGDVTIVEFFDYQCGYCKQVLPDLLKLIEQDKNVRVVIKEFPILGEASVLAASAAIAAKKQGKYWEIHQAMLKEPELTEDTIMRIASRLGLDTAKLKKDMTSKDVEDQITQTHDLARKLEIDSTPSFIIDNKQVPGALSVEQFKRHIADARKK